MHILVSACLLGLRCRYDGGAKADPAIAALSDTHTLIPFCPEVYGGLPTPREPSEIRAGRVVAKGGADVTTQFALGAAEAVLLARALRCTCAVLKDNSPSCGVGTVYDGTFTGTLTAGDGLTATALREAGLCVLPASAIGTEGLCP